MNTIEVKLSFLGGFITSFIFSLPYENMMTSALTASVAAMASYCTSMMIKYLWSRFRNRH